MNNLLKAKSPDNNYKNDVVYNSAFIVECIQSASCIWWMFNSCGHMAVW